MNKTIIININGIVFHIEEDAYEILKNYMTDVKRHFLTSDDSLEITTDIENRIAEMFADILARENKQVIIEPDVRLVIEQMGTVEDFEHAEQESKSTTHDNYTDKNIGTRTLFRDPDDHLIAGVCAGLANYFNIEAVWVRLLFALAIVFGGTGFILYIILWIVIPKAITRGDRMAMKGQKLNLQGFKDNFEEELSAMHNHFSNLQKEAKPLAYKVRDFTAEFLYHLSQFFNGAGKVLVKLLGLFILLICFSAAIGLIACLAMVMVWGTGPIHLFPFSVIGNRYADAIYFSAFLLAFIPIVAITLLTIKAIFNVHAVGRSTGAVLLIIWMFALGSVIYYGSRIASGFRSAASFSQTLNLKQTASNTYYLKLNDIKYFTHADSARLNIKSNFQNMVVTNDDDFEDLEPNNISINIEKGDVSQPILIESFHAKGHRYEDALFNARNTRYIYTQQDSVIKFDRRLQRLDSNLWHAEELELTLKVPLNSTVVIDRDLDRYFRSGFNVYQCAENNKRPDATSAAFIMTANGLECKIDTLVAPVINPDTAKAAKTKQGQYKPGAMQ